MKLLTFLFLFTIPQIIYADPEYSMVLRYLVNLPSNVTDAEAIQGLQKMNVSQEARSQVGVITVTEMKRYELALYMMKEGYQKITTVGEIFAHPFSDNGEPNRKQLSARKYTEAEMTDFVKTFISMGVVLTPGDVQAVHSNPELQNLAGYLKTQLSAEQLNEYNQLLLRQLLNKRPVNVDEVEQLISTTGVKPTTDVLMYANIDDLRLTKLLLDNGADPNVEDALVNAINKANIDVVKLLLERGADPCRNSGTQRGVLEYTAHFIDKAKSSERKDKLKEIQKIVKAAAKGKCK